MSHFAQVKNGIVTGVIVAEQDFIDSGLVGDPKEWIQTSYNTRGGGNGGSGIVILSIPTAFYTGTVTGSPSVTTSGSNTIVSWLTGSGTYTA
jgi:hypothetical protein